MQPTRSRSPRRRSPLPFGAAALTLAALGATPVAAQSITRILLPGGVEPVSSSAWPSLSADGQRVVFGNTGPSPLDGYWDIYMHDLSTGTTTAVVSGSPGQPGATSALNPTISGDGGTITYRARVGLITGILVIATGGGLPVMVSVGSAGKLPNSSSYNPALSHDGLQVSFDSYATNLTSLPVGGFVPHVFVRDRVAGSTALISESFAGAAGANGGCDNPSISGDGRHVVFTSDATDLIAPGLDTNSLIDIYVRDRDPDGNGIFDEGNAVAARVSVSSSGAEADNHCFYPEISHDGRFVVFGSWASTLVPRTIAVNHVYLHDRDPDGNGIFDEGNGVTTRASISSLGQEANGSSDYPTISGDGRYVGFRSFATNLSWNTSKYSDVYLHDRDPDENGVYDEGNGQTRLVSTDANHLPGNQGSGVTAYSARSQAVSGGGSHIVFGSMAGNLVPGGTNGMIDIFVRDVCQDTPIDLGFARQGSSGAFPEFLTCGEFSYTTTGTLWLRRAPASTNAVLVIGSASSPTPLLGGTLVPSPIFATLTVPTDATGSAGMTVHTVGGGFSFTMQWVMLDPGLTPPVGFSNAVDVAFR